MKSQPLEPAKFKLCVSFWYQIYSTQASQVGTLKVWYYNMAAQIYTVLWNLKGSLNTDWYEGQFSYDASTKHQIIFEGSDGTGRGYIAIDDINYKQSFKDCFKPDIASPNTILTNFTTIVPFTTVSNPTTSTHFVPQSQYDCDFDQNFCLWTNDKTADLNWVLTNRSLGDFSGPTADHTWQNQTGSFAYLEFTTKSNLKGRLLTPNITDKNKTCFEFFYFMNGFYVNSLSIFLKQSKINVLGTPVWTRAKSQGNRWTRGEVRFDFKDRQGYQIVFEALSGIENLGVIAIDDVRLLPNCPHKIDRFCDFETSDICNYTTSGNFNWKRANGLDLATGSIVDQ